MRRIDSSCGGYGSDDLTHRMALARPEIQGAAFSTVQQICQGAYMRLGQVGDMNVVANSCAVRRGVIGSVDFHRRPPPKRRSNHQGNQMRLRLMVLAEFALRVGAAGVEVAERHPTETVRSLVAAQDALDK